MTINRLKETLIPKWKVTHLMLSVLSMISIVISWEILSQIRRYPEVTLKPNDTNGLRLAVQGYWHDHKDRLEKSAEKISPFHLVNEGYMDWQLARRWESIGIVIHLPMAVTGGVWPSDVIIEANMMTGDRIVLLADGSIQER